MDGGARWRDDAPMPLELTDLELETAARACRALARTTRGEAAKRIAVGLVSPRDALPCPLRTSLSLAVSIVRGSDAAASTYVYSHAAVNWAARVDGDRARCIRRLADRALSVVFG